MLERNKSNPGSLQSVYLLLAALIILGVIALFLFYYFWPPTEKKPENINGKNSEVINHQKLNRVPSGEFAIPEENVFKFFRNGKKPSVASN